MNRRSITQERTVRVQVFLLGIHRPAIFFHRSRFAGDTKSFTNRLASSSQFSFASGVASLNCLKAAGDGRNANGFFPARIS